ncbi:SDR family oxidoreductase [Enterobacter sp. CC120223-11]|uniref:SDR family oxidoreductase n=1 Tax=Enterobacter sp. CC120223-11 TaxID=1378073 RepID=UPI000BCB737B|nr:SDR family oxidoreductase [Enterobacter sp. CC120223-11]SNY63704.1 hypothetical protein SAMN02744775_01036 [Enterobacter sp. CC120223-11]
MTTKVAVVTASDSGIGKQCAIQLARKGFSLGVTWHSDEEGARQTVRELTSLGCQAQAIQLDLSHLPEGTEALEVLIQHLGRIDVLVNNAGRMTKASVLDVTLDDWRKTFCVDVEGALLCSQIAARHMIAQGEGGRIINITSVHEHTPLPQASAYTAAKHALGGLTKSLALELVPHNILVNSVAPGAIATAMNNLQDDDVQPGSMPNIPIARPGKTEEIAGMVAWLCSDDASYVTGQSMIIDGGFMLVNPQFLNEKQA